MQEREILEAYVYYYDALKSLADYPINKSPTIDDLKLSRGVMQKGYREIREKKLDFNLIEYLCFISTKYILNQIHSQFSLAGLNIEKEEDFRQIPGRFMDAIFVTHVKKPNDFRNMLRLCINSPFYFFDSEEFEHFRKLLKAKEESLTLEMVVYEFLSSFWFIMNTGEVKGMKLDTFFDSLFEIRDAFSQVMMQMLPVIQFGIKKP